MAEAPPPGRRAQILETLEALRSRIRALESPRAAQSLAESGVSGLSPGGLSVVATGWPSIDGRLPGGIPRGLVVEWFGIAEHEEAGGEPAGEPARRRTAPAPPSRGWTPPLSLLLHVAHAALATAPAGEAAPRLGAPVLWIGRAVWPYGQALVRRGAGGATTRLLARSLFVDPPDARTRLWALDLALRCRALAAVVADGSGLSMAASRRLQVAAEAGQGLAMLARPMAEFPVGSAAGVRFVVERVPADDADADEDADEGADERAGAPRVAGAGGTRWLLTLRRAKGAAAARTTRGPREGGPSLAAPTRLEGDVLRGVVEVSRDVEMAVALPADVVDGSAGPAVGRARARRSARRRDTRRRHAAAGFAVERDVGDPGRAPCGVPEPSGIAAPRAPS